MEEKWILFALAAWVFAAGCGEGRGPGKGDESKEAEAAGGKTSGKEETGSAHEVRGVEKPWDPSLGTAAIRGVVRFAGKPPRRRRVDMGSEPKCMKLHPEAVLDESILVNPNATLRNVFVWVKKGLESWEFPVPKEPALLDQKGCMFVPHVQGVRAKQPITVRNSDPFLHNIHSFPRRNRYFNFGQPKQGMKSTVMFRRPEVMVKIKCDVHGWMRNFIGVVDHPYFAVTGDEGNFELGALPPGEYLVEAWHEEYGAQVLTVTLGEKESREIEFLFEEK